MKKFYLIGMIVAFFYSCVSQVEYENAERFNFEDFPIQKNLEGEVLEFDSLIMHPRDIQVFDSILVIVESGLDKLFYVYNLDTKKYVSSHIMRGNGPDDMLRPRFVKGKKNRISVCDMNTSKVYEYELKSFIDDLKPVPSYKTKLESQLFVGVIEVGDSFFSDLYGDGGKQLNVFDRSGKKINEIIDYPSSNISYSMAEKRDAYYANIVGNGRDKIAICYSMTDLIEIYSTEGELLHRIHGPEQFFARFKEVSNGNVTTSLPEKSGNRDAYFSPCSDGERLYVLYDGDYVDSQDNDGSCPYLMVFSWNGEPEALYRLSDPVISVAIDDTRRKIYGISINPEYHIVEYSF